MYIETRSMLKFAQDCEKACNCGQNMYDFVALYGKLSEDIHGYPWSGRSVNLMNVDICLIKSIATDMGLGTNM